MLSRYALLSSLSISLLLQQFSLCNIFNQTKNLQISLEKQKMLMFCLAFALAFVVVVVVAVSHAHIFSIFFAFFCLLFFVCVSI